MEKITEQQRKAFEFIRGHIENNRMAPTLRELCSFMSYSAVGSAQDMIAALRRKGLIAPATKQAARCLMLTTFGISFDRERAVEVDDDPGYAIPCLGAVPAGNPLEAIEQRIGTLKISPGMLPSPKPRAEHLFALRAKGLSMIGAGIYDNDWLVVKAQKEADAGAIVVARVQGEATVKRLTFDRANGGWGLKPENPDFSTVWAQDRLFDVVGRVIALQRTF